MPSRTNQDLLPGLVRGEAVAYELLFEQYYDKISRFVTAIIGDSHQAEDIAQNVFLKIWLNRKDERGMLTEVKSLNSLLFTIARNEACDYLRKKASHQKYASIRKADSGDESYRFALTYDLERIENIVERCVDNMPAQRKIVYKLSREEMLTGNEIAERLQLSKRTVDRHISLALEDIRTALGNIISTIALFCVSHWV